MRRNTLFSLLLAFVSGLISSPALVYGFDSFEHIAIGYSVDLKFPEKDQYFEDDPYKLYFDLLSEGNHPKIIGKYTYNPHFVVIKNKTKTREMVLGYGEIVALAGDFFGLTDKTISLEKPLSEYESYKNEIQLNFKNAFRTLTPFDQNPFLKNDNIGYLRSLFKHEFKSLVLSIKKKGGVHFNMVSSHSVYNKIKDQAAYAKSHGYSELLALNIDHFEKDAIQAYITGHYLALDAAKKGYLLKEAGKSEEALDALNRAYAIDGFASHFLSDLFSAGHVRAPRRGLFKLSESTVNNAKGYTVSNVGLMANAMHDEDGYLGLWCKNEAGETWKVFGDGSFFDKKSEDNREMLRRSLQSSVDEVWSVFERGDLVKHKNFKALKYVGEPLKEGTDIVNEIVNHYSLFKIQKDWPKVRTNYYDPSVDSYQNVSSLTGVTSFLKSDISSYDHGNFLSFLQYDHLTDPLQKDIVISCYNTYDRESYWPWKSGQYIDLDDMVDGLLINNNQTQFYSHILLGKLKASGTYFVVSPQTGEDIMEQCKNAMVTHHSLGEVSSSDVVEIRGYIPKSYSYPLATYDNNGRIKRLHGYISNNKK